MRIFIIYYFSTLISNVLINKLESVYTFALGETTLQFIMNFIIRAITFIIVHNMIKFLIKYKKINIKLMDIFSKLCLRDLASFVNKF